MSVLLLLLLLPQGIMDPNRRDYASAFEAVGHPAVLAQLRAHNESLLLLGHMAKNPLEIPAHIRPFVQISAGLPYQVCRQIAARTPRPSIEQQCHSV